MTKPTTIRGVTYPSQRAAAEALGVARQTVSDAARSGRLDSVGLGPRKPGTGTYTRPTTIGGVRYPSRSAAADALGLPPMYLSCYFAVLEALKKRGETDE